MTDPVAYLFKGKHRLVVEMFDVVADRLGPDGVVERDHVSRVCDTTALLRYGILAGWLLTIAGARLMRCYRWRGQTFQARVSPRRVLELPVTTEQGAIIERLTRARLDASGLKGEERLRAWWSVPGQMLRDAGPLPVGWTEQDLAGACNAAWFAECDAPAPAPVSWEDVRVEVEGVVSDPLSCKVVFTTSEGERRLDWRGLDMSRAPKLRQYLLAVIRFGKLDLSSKLEPAIIAKVTRDLGVKLAAALPGVQGRAFESKGGVILPTFQTGRFSNETSFRGAEVFSRKDHADILAATAGEYRHRMPGDD